MSKKHKKKKAFLIQEEESIERDFQFEWESYDITEDNCQDNGNLLLGDG